MIAQAGAPPATVGGNASVAQLVSSNRLLSDGSSVRVGPGALPGNFAAKILIGSDCHLWTGATNSRGYGCYGVNGVSQLAHRVAWELARGPIPDGMTADHLCKVKLCVNPAHIEIVTLAENIRRGHPRLKPGDWCRNGHQIESADDLYIHPAKGTPECRKCRVISRARGTAKETAKRRALGEAAIRRSRKDPPP